eukprot:1681060-Rhodomonas_salina.1
MDGKYFAKMAKDCQLVGPGLTETDVDLTFAKIKERDARRITYAQFLVPAYARPTRCPVLTTACSGVLRRGMVLRKARYSVLTTGSGRVLRWGAGR